MLSSFLTFPMYGFGELIDSVKNIEKALVSDKKQVVDSVSENTSDFSENVELYPENSNT